MVSADDLLAKISDKTVRGIAVVVLDDFENRLVGVFAMRCIVAQYAITYLGLMVRHDAELGGDFRGLVQAPVHPRDHVADLEARILDPNRHAVLRPGAREREQVPTWLQHAQTLGPYLHARHVVVPSFPHEAQAVRRVGDDGVHACVWHGAEHV